MEVAEGVVVGVVAVAEEVEVVTDVVYLKELGEL